MTRKARFVQEAKAASALNHPNIVTSHDISSDGDVDFIAMEYVAGKTPDRLIPLGDAAERSAEGRRGGSRPGPNPDRKDGSSFAWKTVRR